jgi:hypothetical protein
MKFFQIDVVSLLRIPWGLQGRRLLSEYPIFLIFCFIACKSLLCPEVCSGCGIQSIDSIGIQIPVMVILFVKVI